jgi:ParB family chromosome partitioning protein
MLKTKEFTIELEEIDAGENPLRLEGQDKGIAELAESISRIGLINPLVVAPGSEGDRYRLIAGHRRFAACGRVGLKEVQVRIIKGDQREICEIALAENLFRKDLSPVEMAVAVVALIREGGMVREQVASICHRPTAWVREQEEIVSWPADVRNAVHNGWLSVSAASNLALVHDDAHRRFLLNQAKKKAILLALLLRGFRNGFHQFHRNQ